MGIEGGFNQWLEGIGLSRYCDLFAQHRLDLDIMSDLTEADLAELGLPIGDRKRLQRAMAALDHTDETERHAPGPGSPPPRAEAGAERLLAVARGDRRRPPGPHLLRRLPGRLQHAELLPDTGLRQGDGARRHRRGAAERPVLPAQFLSAPTP